MPRFFRPVFRKKDTLALLMVSSCVLLVLFLSRHILLNSLQVIQRPLTTASVALGNFTSGVFGSCSVRLTDFLSLETQRNQLAIERVEIEQMRLQNDALRQEIGFLRRASLFGVPARILNRSVSSHSQTFTIDAGRRDGVVRGAAVIVESGVYVGKVTNVEELFSVVTPSTAPQSATGVSLFNETRTIGIAEGSTGNLIELKFIPADEQIRVNDLVVTSGLESSIPTGLIVGIVNTVRPDPEAPFQHAVLEPLVDLRRFDHVVVLNPERL